MTGGPDDERDLRAAEYVLGTLPAAERAALDLERTLDPATEAAVRGWERRLAPLDSVGPDVVPDAGIWSRIAASLPGRRRTSAANDNRVAALARQVRLWRGTALAAGGLAAGLALFVAVGAWPVGRGEPRYVAVVSRSGESPALIVSVDLAAGTAQVRPVAAETPDGRSLELWYVEGGAPKTLGVIGGSARRVTLPKGEANPEGLFAVSVEPPGGSPTGQPTGPVVYSGKLIRD
ncbi:anti-sigma factor [Methylobacterium sp. Leaf466]|uniref:anti-sigma factor n=1 Tax=Methylobacterium sp. Leaf466 TaxID=1736386 RepID=UPI0006F312BF|nr:anti-sigma factor [Methylobacterium sp. Leaf466]KQT83013.1 hypothetical protein ASG59_18405 [Methylobacterium sp. Leaf466]